MAKTFKLLFVSMMNIYEVSGAKYLQHELPKTCQILQHKYVLKPTPQTKQRSNCDGKDILILSFITPNKFGRWQFLG